MFEKEKNKFCKKTLAACIEAYKQVEPGLAECVDVMHLSKELSNRNIPFVGHVNWPDTNKNKILALDFRLDILLKKEIIFKLKTVKKCLTVQVAQWHIYLKFYIKKLKLIFKSNSPQII